MPNQGLNCHANCYAIIYKRSIKRAYYIPIDNCEGFKQ